MTKRKDSDSKFKNGKGKLLERSKQIKKSVNTNLENKKTISKIVIKNELINQPSGTSNGGTLSSKVEPKTKLEKYKIKQMPFVAQANNSEETLAKMEKKKEKKLDKKLKKKSLKNSKKAVYESKAKEIPESSDTQAKLPTKDSTPPNPKKKKTNASDNKEPKIIKEEATVFVGNLPVNTKRIQLVRLFKPYGPVLVRFRTANGKALFKHKQRKEAGSLNAWVVLKDKETAKRAIELNGTIFKSNHLRVTSGTLNKSSMDVKRTIFVGNLKYSANEEKLREIFSSCGNIDYIRCLRNDKGCKGVAYICFKAPEAVGLALELNETMLDERPLNVERYTAKKSGAKKARESKLETKKTGVSGGKLKDTKKESTDPKKICSTTKKPKFRGIKIGGIKRKPKKMTNQMQKLAKKIAPKEKP